MRRLPARQVDATGAGAGNVLTVGASGAAQWAPPPAGSSGGGGAFAVLVNGRTSFTVSGSDKDVDVTLPALTVPASKLWALVACFEAEAVTAFNNAGWGDKWALVSFHWVTPSGTQATAPTGVRFRIRRQVGSASGYTVQVDYRIVQLQA